MNWTYTTISGRLTITEYQSGFEIEDHNTGKTLWVGDGVDAFDGVMVGTPEFYQQLRQDMEAEEDIYLELIS